MRKPRNTGEYWKMTLLECVFVRWLQQILHLKMRKKSTYTYTIFNTCYYKSIQCIVVTFLPHLRSYQFSVHKIRSPFIEVYLLPRSVQARSHKCTSSLLRRQVKKVDWVVSPRGGNHWLFFMSPNAGEFPFRNLSTPSNKWRWKKKLRLGISGEKESYSRQKYIEGTLRDEYLGCPPHKIFGTILEVDQRRT